MLSAFPTLLSLAALVPLAAGHACIWHPSMWGFNVTTSTFSYDNAPQSPLMQYTFEQWWFHNHLGYPPNEGDFFDLPAGGAINAQVSCDKGATDYWNTSSGGDAGAGADYPCPGQPLSEFHTTGIDDLGGCAIAITYNSDVNSVEPEDFTVISINQTCVWTLNTAFQIPSALPPCPDGGCICAWFWIHMPDSGQEQIYMNGFRCNVTGASGTTPIGQNMVARRCGADPANGKPDADIGNCTIGPKQPFYWDQLERNNMFEGLYAPPIYQDLYYFLDGAQEDIFQDAYISSLGPGSGASATSGSSASSTPASSSSSVPASSTSAPAPSSSSSAQSSSGGAAVASVSSSLSVSVPSSLQMPSSSAAPSSAPPSLSASSSSSASSSHPSLSSSSSASPSPTSSTSSSTPSPSSASPSSSSSPMPSPTSDETNPSPVSASSVASCRPRPSGSSRRRSDKVKRSKREHARHVRDAAHSH